jgi:hypothetical protein
VSLLEDEDDDPERRGERDEVQQHSLERQAGDARTGAPRFRQVSYTPGIRISESWPPSRLYVKSG